MYNSPYLNGFIREPNQTQPIQNIFTNQMPSSNDIFMARYLKPTENIDNILITNKTAFIDLTNKKLIIKDMDLNKTIYDIILPKDEKDIKIEMLEKQLNELKGMIISESNDNATTNNESTKSTDDAKKSTRK